MTGSDAIRFDATAPESHILTQHRVTVHCIFHIKIDAKSTAAGDLRAIAL
jgi:hypothetical protein